MGDSSKCGGDGDGASRSKINPWALQFQKLGLELKCPSCLELLNRPSLLPCNHVFCSSCIPNSTHFGVECLVCKAKVGDRDIRPLPFMENIVGIYKSLEANFCSNLFQPISSDVRTILGQNPVSPNISSAGKMTGEPFDHAHGGKSNSGQSLFSSSRIPCSLNQSVADVADNNDTLNKYGMPIDANGKEQELARMGGIGHNGLGNANSSVPSSQVGAWGPGECMQMERDMIQVAQTLPDSPPSFGDAKCSDNDSCDRRCEHISENSLVRRSGSKTGDVRTGQNRHVSPATATATDSHLRDVKRQKNMNQAPVSGASSELEHIFVSPSDESLRNRSICAFCQSSTISEFTGPMLHYSNEKSVVGEEATASNVIHVHRICIDWAPQVYFVGENVKQLKSEVQRGAKLKCSKCGLKGAALGCFMKSCRRSYHVTCAIGISKCRWDKEDFLLLCPSHRSIKFPSEKLPLEKSNPEKPKICPLTNSWVASNGDKELILCPSGLSAEEKLLLTKFATMSGASVVKLWRPDVTHVIAAMDDDGAYVRTFKTCMAIVSGRWILTIDWVKACMETMHHVDEEPYEFRLDNYGYCNAPKTGRLRGLNNDPKLFCGLNFYFSGDFELERKEDLQDIIIAAGGTFSNSTEEVLVWSSQAASRTLVVYNLDPPEDCQLGEEVTILWQRSNEAQDIAARIGSQIIGHMWLLESVSRCELQPIIC